MKKLNLVSFILGITLLISSVSNASGLFTVQGAVSSFKFISKDYGTAHSMVYYIPKSIDLKAKTASPLLVFMHGGGESTATYATSRKVAIMYIQDFIDFAEQHKVIVIAPATSIGWNFYTRFTIRQAIDIAVRELPIDTNRVVLSGHSMGAMGISRETPFLVDQVTGFLALSGGTPPGYATDDRLKSYFNTNYTHVNKIGDKFDTFSPWMKNVAAKIQTLEQTLGITAAFKYMELPGDHDYDLPSTYVELSDLFTKTRDLYQKHLFTNFFGINYVGPGTAAQPNCTNCNVRRYFWLELVGNDAFEQNVSKFGIMEANITGQDINITVKQNDFKGSKLRVYLSKKMLDPTQLFHINVNGQIVFSGTITPSQRTKMQIAQRAVDPNYLYDGYVDIALDSRLNNQQKLN